MKAKFKYNGYEIVFYRGLMSAKLIIDGVEHDRCDGFKESQMSSFDLHGKLKNGEEVLLQIKLGFPGDQAYLYVDGSLIEKREVI